MPIRLVLGLALLCGLARADVGRLNPVFEGIYELKLTCATPGCRFVPDVDRAIVMDVGKGGISVTLHSKTANLRRYNFRAISMSGDGQHIEADSTGFLPQNAEWVSDIDPVTGTLTARFRDAAFPGDVAVSGTRVASPSWLYKTQPTGQWLGPLDIQGTYAVSHQYSELTIRQTLSGSPELTASWLLNFGARIDFTESEFLPDLGVLVLQDRGASSALKWTIALKRTTRGGIIGEVVGLSNINGGLTYRLRIGQNQRP